MNLFFDITVHELLSLVLIELGIIMICVLFVAIYSRYKTNMLVKERYWKTIINEVISDTIIQGEVNDDCKVDALILNPKFRVLFLHELVNVQDKFSGMAFDSIQLLFQKFDFERNVIKKLNSNRPQKIAFAFHVIRSLKLNKFLPEVEKFIYHKDKLIYREAQYTYVALRGFHGLHFLNNINRSIPDWEQTRLLNVVKSIPADYHDHIMHWLQSDNVYVLYFSLRLIRKSQLFVFKDVIVDLVNHQDLKVRIQAIKTMMAFENEETVMQLIDMYEDQAESVQFEILKLLAASRNSKIEDFFIQELMVNENQQFQIVSAEALVKINKEDRLRMLVSRGELSMQRVDVVKYVLKESI